MVRIKSVFFSVVCILVRLFGEMLTGEATDVYSNEDMMRWPGAYFENLKTHTQTDPVDLFANFIRRTPSISTAFSGIDAPGVALNMAISSANSRLPGLEVGHPTHTFSVEMLDESNRELALQKNGPSCRFGNILSFCTKTLTEQLQLEIEPFDVDRLMGVILKEGAVTLNAHCLAHSCTCRAVRSVGHVAGPPCTDFTSWGRCRRLKGPTVKSLLVWICLVRLLCFAWVVVENVPSWPEDILVRYLGDMYDFSVSLLCGTSFGSTTVRLRKYIVMTLKTQCSLLRPLTDMTEVLRRRRDDSYTWRSLFVAEKDELVAELRWGRARSGCVEPCASGSKKKHVAEDAQHGLHQDAFYNALLEIERTRLKQFEALHDVTNCVCNLTQDPTYCRAASREILLHTLVKNSLLLWSNEHRRWMTGREMLLSQYFPVTTATLAACERPSDGIAFMTSFNFSRVQAGLPARDRAFMAGQAGNSMTIPVIGGVLIWIASFISWCPSPSLPSAGLLTHAAVGSSAISMWKACRRQSLALKAVSRGVRAASDSLRQVYSTRGNSGKRASSADSSACQSDSGSVCASSYVSASSLSSASTCAGSSTSSSEALLLWKSLRKNKRAKVNA